MPAKLTMQAQTALSYTSANIFISKYCIPFLSIAEERPLNDE